MSLSERGINRKTTMTVSVFGNAQLTSENLFPSSHRLLSHMQQPVLFFRKLSELEEEESDSASGASSWSCS